MTPEGKVKAEIRRGLESLGPDCFYSLPVQYGYGKRMVDFVGCFHGRYFAIEAKAPIEGKSPSRQAKPTRIQEHILAQIQRAGGIAILARSWSDVLKGLKTG